MKNNSDQSIKIPLNVQWHITTKCNNKCKHCYMYDEATYEDEKKNTLSLNGLIKILDDFERFEKKYNANFNKFVLSGGDPLLRRDLFEFLQELKRREKEVSLMANPENLSEEIIAKLSKFNIEKIQMSLDGLEKTHDYFRSKGSFQRTINKLELLDRYGIHGQIMFTLFPTNANELLPLMRFLAKKSKAKTFSFEIGCFVGEGNKLNKNFTPIQLQKVLSVFLTEKENLKKQGYSINFVEKNNLLKVARLDKNNFFPYFSSKTSVISGCLIGWNPPSILSDGTLLACRKMTLKVGKMPQQSFEEIFLGNKELKKFRRSKYFEGCGNCDFYSTCRGCPANVNSLKGDPFAENPLCFREHISKKLENKMPKFEEPSLDTSYQEEWNFLSSRHRFLFFFSEMLENEQFQKAYLEIGENEKKKKEFLKSPKTFCQTRKYKLDEDTISWLLLRFSEYYFQFQNNDLIADQIRIRQFEKDL